MNNDFDNVEWLMIAPPRTCAQQPQLSSLVWAVWAPAVYEGSAPSTWQHLPHLLVLEGGVSSRSANFDICGYCANGRYWEGSRFPILIHQPLCIFWGVGWGGPNSKKLEDKVIRDVMILISISLSNRNCCVRNCDNIPKGLALENKNLMSKYFGIYFCENCF